MRLMPGDCARAAVGAASAVVRAQRNCRRSLVMASLPRLDDHSSFLPSEIRLLTLNRMQSVLRWQRSRHVADCLDLKTAIHRGTASLHARACWQCIGAAEIAAI